MEGELFSVPIKPEVIPSSIISGTDNEQEGLMEQVIPSSIIAAERDSKLQVVTIPEQPSRSNFVSEPPTVSSRAVATPMEQQEVLQNTVDNVASKFPELAFTLRCDGLDSSNPVLTISQRAVFNHPLHGLTSRVCVTIQYKHYKVHVLMILWSEGEIELIDDVMELCGMFGKISSYKFCPGIDPVHYEDEYHRAIQFHIRSVRLSEFPFSRVDSVNCKLWFLPASNISLAEKAASEVKCPPCKRLVHDVNLQRKRTLEESPSKKIKRKQPSSRSRLQHMSPASQQACKRYAQYQRSSNIRKLSKLEDSEVVLSDEQSEMCEVMEAVKAEDLDKLYQEGDRHGVGSIMKTLWMTDKDKQFFLNQEENCEYKIHVLYLSCLFSAVGGRGNRWNMITILMGK